MFRIGAAINQFSLKHDWLGLSVAESHRVATLALADPAMHPAGTVKHWTYVQSSQFRCV